MSSKKHGLINRRSKIKEIENKMQKSIKIEDFNCNKMLGLGKTLELNRVVLLELHIRTYLNSESTNLVQFSVLHQEMNLSNFFN